MRRHLASFWALLLAFFSANSFARGGVGGDPSVLLGVVVLFVIGVLGLWLHKSYPSLFPTIGGLVILLIVSQFLAAILIGLGIVEQRYLVHAMVVIALACLLGPAAWSRIRSKP